VTLRQSKSFVGNAGGRTLFDYKLVLFAKVGECLALLELALWSLNTLHGVFALINDDPSRV